MKSNNNLGVLYYGKGISGKVRRFIYALKRERHICTLKRCTLKRGKGILASLKRYSCEVIIDRSIGSALDSNSAVVVNSKLNAVAVVTVGNTIYI